MGDVFLRPRAPQSLRRRGAGETRQPHPPPRRRAPAGRSRARARGQSLRGNAGLPLQPRSGARGPGRVRPVRVGLPVLPHAGVAASVRAAVLGVVPVDAGGDGGAPGQGCSQPRASVGHDPLGSAARGPGVCRPCRVFAGSVHRRALSLPPQPAARGAGASKPRDLVSRRHAGAFSPDGHALRPLLQEVESPEQRGWPDLPRVRVSLLSDALIP